MGFETVFADAEDDGLVVGEGVVEVAKAARFFGAAGGVEAVFSVLALAHNVVPPTINYQTPDPECDLDYCANESRAVNIDVAVSNSFGFGGTNGTLIFKSI